MAKIYTKTGDAGITSLLGGTRVAKDDLRVEAYGTVDELNSHMGVICILVQQLKEKDEVIWPHYLEEIRHIQNQLFVVQTLLATEKDDVLAKLPQLSAEAVDQLEHWIDELSEKVPPMKAFVIPGGTMLSAQCHVARTICRRAERRVVSLMHDAKVPPALQRYLNRLSDYLFSFSRFAVFAEGQQEIVWQNK